MLRDVSTSDLVRELEKREGVRKIIAEPYKEVISSEVGPATILVIID